MQERMGKLQQELEARTVEAQAGRRYGEGGSQREI